MRFVLDTGASARECTAEVATDDVTVAELLEAAGVDDPGVVHVDGRRVPTDHLLTEAAVCDGATIGLRSSPTVSLAGADAAVRVPRIAVVAGAGTGQAVPLTRAVTVGRDPGCDLVLPSDTVDRLHVRFVRDGRGGVSVTDLGTTNGTWVGGHRVGRGGATATVGALVRVGAVVVRIEPATGDDVPRAMDPLRHRTAAGTVPFNRPPRPGVPPPVDPVAVPELPTLVGTAPPFNVAALLAPVVLGAVMVLALGSWRYAAFMALSPLLLLANTLSGRRRARRDARRAEREERVALAAFRDRLAQAAEAERGRRWEASPSVAETLRRATQPSIRLWERRTTDADVLRLQVGVGALPWEPPTATARGGGSQADAIATALAQWTRLPRAPVEVDLSDGGVVGIVGDRARARDLARCLLLQACVHHGPADLAAAIVVDRAAVGDWSWVSWLPHTDVPGSTRLLAAGHQDGRDLLARLRDRHVDGTTMLLVLDAPALLRGRDADARAVLRGDGGPVAGIVLADTADQLPAVCDTVIDIRSSDGLARLTRPSERRVVDDVLVAGLSPTACLPASRRLAGLEDPEQDGAGGGLPTRVDLVTLLPDGLDVARAWSRTREAAGLRTPIGVGPDGPVDLDLVADGPHGLLGGTTGSGKSELLRSLVAGLAASYDPDHVTFVLVDYKGGAAFDACADLPHVVGLVTDLDEHLGARALRCLEAELSHRETRLRAAGVSDLPAWRRLPDEERGAPLPRLLVVVDEFATLRAELPDFVDALVGIAQRGRSLGVHLLLGTQRPSGAVDENVRANANLRIALRMTDDRDAVDVVGTPDAAVIPPSIPGRGLLRTGPGAPVALQTALVTGRSGTAQDRVRVAPLRFGIGPDTPAAPGPLADHETPTDLMRLVEACRAAFDDGDIAAPRTPWPDPLPATLDLDDLDDLDAVTVADGAPAAPVPVGLLDDPDRQRQVVTGWEPSRGNLLVIGAVGSGTTTTLQTVVLSAARRFDADALHLHVLDLGRGELTALADLPHCGAVVTARESERRARLQAMLLAEADRRRHCDHDELARASLHLLVVDGLATWLDELDDPATYETFEAVQRLVVDAPRLRMAVVGSVPRPGAVRSAVAASIEQRLVHRLADPNDLAALGLRPAAVPDLPAGRAVTTDGAVVQVARVADVAHAIDGIRVGTPAPRTPSATVEALPARLAPAVVAAVLAVDDGVWRLPVGLDALTLEPVGWDLHTGDHAVVLGPPGSGRTPLLRGLADLVGEHADVVVVTPDPSEWPAAQTVCQPSDLPAVLADAAQRTDPVLVLIDDADHVPDPGPALDMLATGQSQVRLVAAARPDLVQTDYGHWLRRAARGRTGCFLAPRGDVPGELLGARVPRRPPLDASTGRGWLVAGGDARFVQAIGAG